MSDHQDVWAPSEATAEDGGPKGPAEDSGKLPDVVNLLSEVFDDLMANFVGYLLSGVGIAVVAMVAVFVMLGLIFGGMFGSAVLGQVLGYSKVISMLGMVGAMAGYLVVILGLVVVTAPMSASIARAVLAHQEEGVDLTVTASFSTFTVDLVQVVLLTVITFALGMVGVLFCYVGALVVALFLSFAFPAVVVHRLSAMDAIALSVRHVRENLVWHLGFWGLGMAILLAGQAIPLVGMLIGLPIFYAYQVKAYTRVFPADQPVGALIGA